MKMVLEQLILVGQAELKVTMKHLLKKQTKQYPLQITYIHLTFFEL